VPVDDLRSLVASNPRWYHTIELAPGIVTPGLFDLRGVVDRLPWPNVRGARCLDIATYDGFFAFELERRGAAEVVATDIKDYDEWDLPEPERAFGVNSMKAGWGEKGRGFAIAKEALGSAVRREWVNVYDLSPERVGMFDVIVCGSLLLHLSDPIGALRAIRSVCKGVFLSAEAIDPFLTFVHRRRPVTRLMGVGGLRQWFVPNAPAQEHMLVASGFSIERAGRPYSVPFRVPPPRPRTPRIAIQRALERAVGGRTGVVHRAILARPA
jgi:tRNA (mo5U34)-methyltransferase